MRPLLPLFLALAFPAAELAAAPPPQRTDFEHFNNADLIILTHGRNVRTGDVSFDSHQHIEITEGDVLQGTATFPVRYYHRRPDNF
ncbi:MAG: hypothetical protein AAGK14_15290, partial [Verrucomicrobiota bacterium]